LPRKSYRDWVERGVRINGKIKSGKREKKGGPMKKGENWTKKSAIKLSYKQLGEKEETPTGEARTAKKSYPQQTKNKTEKKHTKRNRGGRWWGCTWGFSLNIPFQRGETERT